MKVMFVSPYLYEPSYVKFQKNRTGFGILLNQMVKYIGISCELIVFTNVITPELKLHGSTILKHSWWDVIKNTSVTDFMSGMREAMKKGQTFRERLLCLYYKINCGALRRVINDQKPDLIHCHGVGRRLNWYYEICINSGIPVLMTLHGLIGAIGVAETDKIAEIAFLKNAQASSYPVTVISSGIKRRLSSEPYNLVNTDNVSVILNGTDIIPHEINLDIRRKYGILKNEKLLITIGNVCHRKNQIQIIKAISLLPRRISDMVRLIIIGNVLDNYPIEVEIRKYGLERKVIIAGFVPHEELQNYYSAANLNVLASIDEGFGLSMVEGFVYGVPCVTFSDLDAVPDIYDERAMLLCENRADEDLAKSIEMALNKRWDKEWIMEYSKNFSLKKMAERYIDLYKRIVYGSK